MFARIRSAMTPRAKSFRREGFNCDSLRSDAFRLISRNMYS